MPQSTPAPRRVRAYRWLAALPGVAMLGGVPFANRVHPYVLGLPFLLFWIVLWVLGTAAVMAVVYTLDEAAERRSGTADAGSPGAQPHTGGAP